MPVAGSLSGALAALRHQQRAACSPRNHGYGRSARSAGDGRFAAQPPAALRARGPTAPQASSSVRLSTA